MLASAGRAQSNLAVEHSHLAGIAPTRTDLASFFVRVLEDGSARGRYVIGNGLHQTVAELTEAAAAALDAPGAVPGSEDELRARLGDYLAEVLLLDQAAAAARARTELGWSPAKPGLADEFRRGSYRL